MSSVIAKNHQVGNSLTSTDNLTIYQPSTPDGTLRVGVGNAGATTSDVFQLSASGATLPLGTANGVAYLNASKVLTAGSGLQFDGSTLSAFNAGTSQLQLGFSNAYCWNISRDNATTGNLWFTSKDSNGTNTRLTLDSAGNLGLGVTPSAWASANFRANQIAYSTAVYSNVGNTQGGVSSNAYYNGGWKYITTNPAITMEMYQGTCYWNIAPSGTAGNAITFTQAMTLDASGNLGVGVTSPTFAAGTGVQINNAASSDARLRLTNAGTGTSNFDGFDLVVTSAGQVNLVGWENQPMTFLTNATERARISASGYFKATNSGTYVSTAASYHEFVSDVGATTVYCRNTNTSTPNGIETNFNAATPNNTTQFFFSASDSTNQKAVIYSSGTFGSRTSTYGGISDLKLKQDIVDAGSQWDDIKALRFRKYRFKDDPTGPLQLGLISQEAELVSPGLVFDSPDYEEVEVTDEDGNVTKERQPTGEVTKSVKYSIVYMKAVKALQEAMERIENQQALITSLTARIAALETK